jgi:hypothetical protein
MCWLEAKGLNPTPVPVCMPAPGGHAQYEPRVASRALAGSAPLPHCHPYSTGTTRTVPAGQPVGPVRLKSEEEC